MSVTKEMEKQNTIKFAIWESRNTFYENGYKDEESLKSWLGQSLYCLYKDNSMTGFSITSVEALKGSYEKKGLPAVDKNDVLDFLIKNYIKNIDGTDEKNIRDDFQTAMKLYIESEGINIARASLKAYMKRGDLSNYTPKAKEIIEKYNKDSLLQSMGIITINNVLAEPTPDVIIRKVEDNSSGKFFASDFAVLSNGEYDISKTVNLMEGIRSGRINTVKENIHDISER